VITRRLEAMKVLLRDQATQPEFVQRFLREVQVQASLNHPNIASVHNAFLVQDDLLLIMELIDGESLESMLQRGPLPWPDAVRYACQALAALAYAHAKAITHRDIKPGNIMITPDGAVKITDFGLAKIARDDMHLTHSGAVMGSVHYAPPEQVKGSAVIDGRSDIYSLGVVLYEMVTGRKPFDGDSRFAIMSAQVADAPAPPIERRPDLPQSLNDVILTSLAKKPEERFASAGEFFQALQRVGSAAEPAPSNSRSMWVELRQSRLVRAGAAIVALALGVVLIGHSRPIPAVPTETSAESSPVRKPPASALILSAGTSLRVVITRTLSTATHGTGDVFFATLKDPLVIGSEIVAKAGAVVEGRVEHVEKGGRFKGRDLLVVRLTRLHTIERGPVAIASDSISRQGGAGFLKRAPALLPAGSVLSFHNTFAVAVRLPQERASSRKFGQ
jgi:serine/threonine protein kinase